jgi:hypothetical protein
VSQSRGSVQYNYSKQRFEFFKAFADGFSGFLPAGATYAGGGTATRFSHYDYTSVTVDGRTSGRFHAVFENIALQENPQNSTIDTIPTDLKARVMDIVGNCAEVMSNFLKALGKHVYSTDLEQTFNRMTSITIDAEPFKAPFVPKGADGLSGDRKIFILPAESVAKLAPEFRWNKVAKVVVQELLHQSRDHGLFYDRDLDKAGLTLLSGQDLIDAKKQMKARGYEPGTVGHGVIGRNCYSTNPYGPPPK